MDSRPRLREGRLCAGMTEVGDLEEANRPTASLRRGSGGPAPGGA